MFPRHVTDPAPAALECPLEADVLCGAPAWVLPGGAEPGAWFTALPWLPRGLAHLRA